MRGISAFLLLVLLPLALNGQRASVREEMIPMKTYMFSDPDPVPNIGRIYPYFRFDGFTAHAVTKSWKMVVLENPYIKVYVSPDIGGKVWGAIEKSTGKAFLYYNHVVKFRDVAMRGPWTSGGLEYNFGDIGHIPTCATPVDYVVSTHDDGSVSCTVGAVDLPSRTKWNVEIRLDPDKAYFETRTVWVNNTPLPNTYYHWMNAAAKAAGNLHFIYPGNRYIGHGGKASSWPVEKGRGISWYENNDFGSYKSYHVINAYTNFFGGYWQEDDFGFGHMARYDEKPGKKLWLWGLSRQGMIWEDLLTDSDGQYIEFQAGKLFNQAAYSSTFTPFKHKEFPPCDADVMVEQWFPLVRTGGMVAASQYAVLNVVERAGEVLAKISALQELDDTLVVREGGKVLEIKRITLYPLQQDSLIFRKQGEGVFRITLGKTKLTWSSDTADHLVDRPVETGDGFDWNTAYGWYVRGLESEKQRRYREALDFYGKALEKEKLFVPALDRKAMLLYKKMEYSAAVKMARTALSVDAYDPLANYVYGLGCMKAGEKDDARSGFSIAAASVAFRTAAYTQLSRSFLADEDYPEALHYAEKALDYNRYNISALQIEAVVFRKTLRHQEAFEVVERLEALDPTLHFISFEKYLLGRSPEKDFLKSFYNELPAQSFLELALFYHGSGCDEEAVRVLSLAPADPLVLLWRACLEQDHREGLMQQVTDASIAMVFPYRAETAEALEELLTTYDNWKLKYYLALIYWNKERTEEARRLFVTCGTEPDEVPFWLAKARLMKDDQEAVQAALQRARALNPADWRAALAWIRFNLGRGRAAEMLPLAKTFAAEYPENSALGLTYAKTLIQAKEYRRCIAFLGGYNVLPFEGAADGRELYHRACVLEAMTLMEKRKYRNAVVYLQKAMSWPENLGAGRPYDVDERMENYLTARAYEGAGEKMRAREWYGKVASYANAPGMPENSKLIFRLWALDKLGRQQEAAGLLQESMERSPEHPYLQWVKALYQGDVPTAAGIENKILRAGTEERPYDVTFRDRDFEMISGICSILIKRETE